MTKVYKIRKGLDIRLQGNATATISDYATDQYALRPADFLGIVPKMMVQEGDWVKAGQSLFHDKRNPEMRFASPVSGKVTAVVRGEKRVLEEVRVVADKSMEYEDFGKADALKLGREEVIAKMLASGCWPMVRQRPYNVIANPVDEPKAIFVSGFDTAPLAPDYNLLVEGEGSAFQSGLNALTRMTKGKVYLNLRNGVKNSDVFTSAKNVEISLFDGPHPAGNVGTQIAQISPINKGEVIWHVSPSDVIIIGRLFLDGRYDARKIVALVGSEISNPRYFRLISGSCVKNLVSSNVKSSGYRTITGNVLTGVKLTSQCSIGFYDSQITVIPEGNHYEFLGWAMPRLDKHSFSKSYFAWLMPGRKFVLDTNLNGGARALVMTGEYEKVFPFDIYPMHLLKAIINKDIDGMEQLGIYEVVEEDFALCEYIDTSKTEIQSIVREGLDMLRAEMS